jgi:hypothetical protein
MKAIRIWHFIYLISSLVVLYLSFQTQENLTVEFWALLIITAIYHAATLIVEAINNKGIK